MSAVSAEVVATLYSIIFVIQLTVKILPTFFYFFLLFMISSSKNSIRALCHLATSFLFDLFLYAPYPIS